jgi:hypothetical protein
MSKDIELYVSTDIETDGPIPGPHSMLSFGSAVFAPNGQLVDKFSAQLDLLPGAQGHPDTMKWWATQPEAWAEARRATQPPELVMKRYVKWLNALPGKPVFVGYPAGFDFLFIYWYLIKFTGGSPFSFSALDIKTYAMAVMNCPYREATKKRMPSRWFSQMPHTHKALDDAMEQGLLFINIKQENQKMLNGLKAMIEKSTARAKEAEAFQARPDGGHTGGG